MCIGCLYIFKGLQISCLQAFRNVFEIPSCPQLGLDGRLVINSLMSSSETSSKVKLIK